MKAIEMGNILILDEQSILYLRKPTSMNPEIRCTIKTWFYINFVRTVNVLHRISHMDDMFLQCRITFL